MEIQKEQIDDLQIRLSITLEKDDYYPQYEASLKQYRKQVNMPGFRPGNVPMGLIRKQYGPAILSEELHKVLNNKLYEHIIKEKLNILGNPLPSESDDVEGDFKNPDKFTFQYDLGLAPEIDLEKATKKPPVHYKVKIDKKLVDQHIDDLRRRNGDVEDVEVSEENDLLIGTFTELDKVGNVKEEGITNDSNIALEFLEDKKLKKKLIGLKKDDEVTIDPKKLSKDHDEVAAKLGVTHEEVHGLKNEFSFKVTDIKRINKLDLGEDLYKKVLGEETDINDEEAFRTKVTAHLEEHFTTDTRNVYKRKLSDHILEQLDAPLPDDFLMRWLASSNEQELDREKLEAEYPDYAKYLRWQLVQSKVMREKEIQISEEEVHQQAKAMLASQYSQYGIPMNDELLDQFAANMLSDHKEKQRVHDMIAENKVLDGIIEDLKFKEKEVSFDDFKKWAGDE